MVSLYNNRLNGILADEMVRTFFPPLMVSCLLNLSCLQGLGKTIQTILPHRIPHREQEATRTIPSSLCLVTIDQLVWRVRASGRLKLKLFSYKGNPAQRRILQGELRVGHFQVLLTT